MKNFDPWSVMQDFLLDVIETVPDELIQRVRSLQNEITILEHELAGMDNQAIRMDQARDRLKAEVVYLRQQVISLADIATKATVIEPLVQRLKAHIAEHGDIDFIGGPNE